MTYNPAIAASSAGGAAYIVSKNLREEKIRPLTKEGTFYKKAFERCEYQQIFNKEMDFEDCLRREIMICEREYSPVMDGIFSIGAIILVMGIIILGVLWIAKRWA